MHINTIESLTKAINNKKAKIKAAERELIALNEKRHTYKLIKAGKLLEDAGLLDTYDYNKTLQILLLNREECICKSKKN